MGRFGYLAVLPMMLVLLAACAGQPPVELSAPLAKDSPLAQAMAIFRQAEGEGAAGAAPKTYQKARETLVMVNAVIERDPNNTAAIANAVQRFHFEAEHLLHLNREVRELRSINPQALENIVLAAEYRLLAISDALKQPDPRRHGLYEQATAVEAAAEKLQSALPENATPHVVPVSKTELDDARARIEQLQVQLRSAQQEQVAFQRGEKAYRKRIDELERLVLRLNAQNTELESRRAALVKEVAELQNKLAEALAAPKQDSAPAQNIEVEKL
jgi:hypothetical protein